jgi:hypothetical protein
MFRFPAATFTVSDESSLHRHCASVIEEEQTNSPDIRGINSILTRYEGVKCAAIAVDAVPLDNVFS